MSALNEADFIKHVGHVASFNNYEGKFGDFWIRLWVGGSASSRPQGVKTLPLSDYTHFEASINSSEADGSFGFELRRADFESFLNKYDIREYWDSFNGLSGPARSVYLPAKNLIKVIEILKGNSVAKAPLPSEIVQRIEKPCPQCQRLNDVGVVTCWYCMRSYPAGQ